jgi:hypothetical protein
VTAEVALAKAGADSAARARAVPDAAVMPPMAAGMRPRRDAVMPPRIAARPRTRRAPPPSPLARSRPGSSLVGRASCSTRPRPTTTASSTGGIRPPTRSPTWAGTTCALADRAGSTSAATETRATPPDASPEVWGRARRPRCRCTASARRMRCWTTSPGSFPGAPSPGGLLPDGPRAPAFAAPA